LNDPSREGLQDIGNLQIGDVLAGKFRIERVLGRGGMGVVVQAMHLHLDQRVALKFLLPDALVQPETLARFSREARAAAKIKSEHVARVIDVGTLDGGSPYIVMEYLEGEDLCAHLRKSGPLSTSQATGFVLQACEALAEAHAAGIVHRDLKPANLFLARYPDGTPCVKLLDFGISKFSSGESGRDFDMTRPTALMGSPFYMSPEQMRSTRSVDARADIWALGVILYELVSGRLPFDADTMPELCAKVLQESPAALGNLAQSNYPTFEAVVLRCLEKDRGQRFQSIADLANALAPFAPHEAQRSLDLVARLSGAPSTRSSKAPVSISAGAVSAESATQTDFGRTARRHGSSRPLLIGLALSLGAGVGTAGWLLSRPSTPTAASAAPPPTTRATESATESQTVRAPAALTPSPSAQTPPAATSAVPSTSASAPPTGASPKPAAKLVPETHQKARPIATQAPASAAAAPAAAAPAAAAPAATTPTGATPAATVRPPSALDGRL
jgi:serine/threonine-protein kinase